MLPLAAALAPALDNRRVVAVLLRLNHTRRSRAGVRRPADRQTLESHEKRPPCKEIRTSGRRRRRDATSGRCPRFRNLAIARRRYQPRASMPSPARSSSSAKRRDRRHDEGDIPVRALSPALFIGGVEVAENERVAGNEYRFFVTTNAR